MDESTQPRTLWSETLMEMLCEALRKNKDDRELKHLLQELRTQGMNAKHVLRHVKREVGQAGLSRIQQFFKPKNAPS